MQKTERKLLRDYANNVSVGNHIEHENLEVEFGIYLKERYNLSADRTTMIEQFRERNFILSLYGAKLYTFVHRAFPEYFCASAFVWKYEKTKELTIDQLKRNAYGKYWDNQNWHEVLRLICGMIEEKWAGRIIGYLKQGSENAPLRMVLAVPCLREVPNLKQIEIQAAEALDSICLFVGREMISPHFYWITIDYVVPAAELNGTNWPRKAVLTRWLQKIRPTYVTDGQAEEIGKFVGLIGGKLSDVHDQTLVLQKIKQQR